MYSACVLIILLASGPVFAYLWFRPAPYGRHGATGWGPEVPGRMGWLLMEAPTLLVFVPLVLQGGGSSRWALGALWLLHYGYRTLVYPLRLPSVRPMPLAVVASGCGFQLLNTTSNGLATASAEISWVALLIGGAVFLMGQAVHHHGDQVLMDLREPGQTGYAIPRRGLYRWVSNVSYLGEILTWIGWTIASGSMAGFAMMVFTMANLVPRARSNHAWYHQQFEDYPTARRSLLPGLW